AAARPGGERGGMDCVESAVQRMLRSAVAQLAGRYGRDYIAEKVRSDGRTTELWDEAGRLGYLGVAVPEEYGGGGRGIYELHIVGEELAAGGCPLLLLVVSPALFGPGIAPVRAADQRPRALP